MDLEEELAIRRARIAELEARDRVREELHEGDAERVFWARVEWMMQTKPGAKERYEQRLFDDALELLEQAEASQTKADTDDASRQWGVE